MLTKEREREIRNRNSDRNRVKHPEDVHVTELLAEIDRLRANKDRLENDLVNREARLNVVLDERDQARTYLYDARLEIMKLKAENDKLLAELVETKLQYPHVIEHGTLTEDQFGIMEENQKLRERIAKLREVIEYAIGPTRDYKNPMLKQALAQDDELSQNEDKQDLSRNGDKESGR